MSKGRRKRGTLTQADYRRIHSTLTEQETAQLDELATKAGMSRDEYISWLIQQALERTDAVEIVKQAIRET